MYKKRLCLGAFSEKEMPIEAQIRLFGQVGYDGFFTMWSEKLPQYKALAEECGMIFQSVHAPFNNAAKMWQAGPAGEEAVSELLRCVRDTAAVEVPILVVHPYIGFEDKANVTAAGIENFGRVVREAKALGVKIAFENVEGEEYLAALLSTFGPEDGVGFCWDSGHELCYNRSKDMLALYGDRLCATHLNDNLGVSRYDGRIYWTDDLHLLPFDGIADWNGAADRLCRCGYDGILTFELNRHSKPNRHDNDKYGRIPFEEYVAESYARACRVAYLMHKSQE